MSIGSLAASESTPQVVVPYHREKALFNLLGIISIVFWLALTVGTVGLVWLYMAFLYLFALFAHSALISHLKGNAVRINEKQFPDLHAKVVACAGRVGLQTVPEAFLMTGDGMLNAFATRFLRRYYVVLLSDVVDALEDDPEAINFYIGHELGHIDRQHIARGWWMAPAMLLPLVGAAYRRAQEYSCDQYGLACCPDRGSAMRALAVLAAGPQRWKQLDAAAYAAQCDATGGFWMSLNELASDYPWLCKRMAQLQNPERKSPSRHPLAWLLALFMPRVGAGGPLIGLVVMFAIIGVGAAIAIPQYQNYKLRAEVAPAFEYGEQLVVAAGKVVASTEELPETIEELGVEPAQLALGTKIDPETATITLSLITGETISYTPNWEDYDDVTWTCTTTLPSGALPENVHCESVSSGLSLLNSALR